MNTHWPFCLAFALLLVHEMDAFKQKEWKMFYIFSKLGELTAQHVFALFHIPLYGLLLYGLLFNESTRSITIIILDGFFIIHLGLHILFFKHRMNNFTNFFSLLYIILPALLGTMDLLYFF